MDTIKNYDEFVFENAKAYLVEEGLMAQIDTLVKDTKDIEEFVKKFFKEYGDKIKKNTKSEEWVRGLYDSTIKLRESLNEAKWSNIMNGVRKAPQPPFSVVAIHNGKVVGQTNGIKIADAIPAHYEDLKKKYPGAKISIENGEGLSVFNESADMLPSWEVLIGLATAMGAIDLAQAIKDGEGSIIKDLVKLVSADVVKKMKRAGNDVKDIINILKGDPKIKKAIKDADAQISESLSEAKAFGAKDILKAFKNTKDWGDAAEQSYMKGGNLVYVDTWFYGQDKAMKDLKTSWEPGGDNYKYWNEKHGVTFKIVDTFSEIKASGRHKKLTSDGIVGVVLEVTPGKVSESINEAKKDMVNQKFWIAKGKVQAGLGQIKKGEIFKSTGEAIRRKFDGVTEDVLSYENYFSLNEGKDILLDFANTEIQKHKNGKAFVDATVEAGFTIEDTEPILGD